MAVVNGIFMNLYHKKKTLKTHENPLKSLQLMAHEYSTH